MTVAQLATDGSAGTPATVQPALDAAFSKIHAGSIPADMPPDRLLARFSCGWIQEETLEGESPLPVCTRRQRRPGPHSLILSTSIIWFASSPFDGKKWKPTTPGIGDAASTALLEVEGQLAWPQTCRPRFLVLWTKDRVGLPLLAATLVGRGSQVYQSFVELQGAHLPQEMMAVK